MARSKATVCCCCSVIVISVVVIIVCIGVFAGREHTSAGKLPHEHAATQLPLGHTAGCPRGSFPNAAVSTDSKICSAIGKKMLLKGGSAVDAAIAALLCTFLVNPHSAGIGGGSIFTIMDSDGNFKIINSRETAPAHMNSSLLQSCNDDPMWFGSKWIGVPGEIRGYKTAHQMYGKLPWSELFQPTIQLARKGISVSKILGYYFENFPNNSHFQSLRKYFSDKHNRLPRSGDTLMYEKLADTLEIIANDGSDEFYTGKIAEDLVEDVQAAGGTLTLEDLKSYNVTVTDALTVPLGEYKMTFPPSPAGGVLLTLMLNIMRGYYLKHHTLNDREKILFYHRYIEAFKFANGLKKHIRDPKFFPNELETSKKFLEKSFGERIRSWITDDMTHDPKYYNSSKSMDTYGTTHVSVVHEDGSAVSVTSTINTIFGSKFVSPKTGIILNNELRDFCGRVDNIFPGERPPSSMSPTVLKSKSKLLVIGGSGGSMITSALASAILNHVVFGKSLEEAIAAPIVFVDSKLKPNFEPSFNKDIVKALKTLGHNEGNVRTFYNVVNAVEKEDGCICTVADARKFGEGDGY